MRPDELEWEIRRAAERLAVHMREAAFHRAAARKEERRLADLIAQRTPAEVEQMERERGLR